MIQLIKDDLFKAKEDVLIHSCNCFCTWGAGVAKTMKKLYPEAWNIDDLTKKGDKGKLGTFTFWYGKHHYYDQDIIVINLYSQYKYGHGGVYTDYDAIRTGLEAAEFVFRSKSFAMPKIGCGLAGGDWDVVSKIIESVFVKNNARVYYL